MAASELYKLDHGNNYPSNCFPIRSFFRQKKEGAGHWLVAHRNAMENRYRGGRIEPGGQFTKFPNSNVAESTGVENIFGNTLDGNFLMKLHCVDQPSDLCSVDISEQRLKDVKTEDLVKFDNVAYVNASDNRLGIEPFSKFPFLRELELSLNRLCNITLNPDGFPHLEMLDLSYNNLSADDIMCIGLLPCLKVIHLTGNHLKAFTPDLGAPLKGPSQRAGDDISMRFRALEVLMLDDNNLSSEVFSSLANLKRLQHLNLQGNHISGVPYLQQTGRSQLWKTHNKQCGEEQDLSNYLHSSAVIREAINSIHVDSDDPKLHNENFKNHCVDDSLQVPKNFQSFISFDTVERDGFSGIFSLPLPELRFLNLANNKIVEEEALLAVALFPMLSELVIHSNPLTMQRSGDPPVLTYFLQERLGIRICRKETPVVVKPPLILSMDSKRKVKTKIPKVPKVSLLLAAPSQTNDHRGPLEKKEGRDEPIMTPVSQGGNSIEMCGRSSQTKIRAEKAGPVGSAAKSNVMDVLMESAGETYQEGESFFVTQVTDLPDSDDHPPLDMKEVEEEIEKNEPCGIPEKFRGYELLWDAKPDPDMPEPVGIQLTVRMLEHSLKNLLVYRDSQPKLDCLQNPYTEKEKKIRKLPPRRPQKQRGERVQEMLLEMKGRKTVTKLPLDNVLKGKDVYKEEYEEALSLLRDMKKKYKMVHMKTIDQATHIEFERTNQTTCHVEHTSS